MSTSLSLSTIPLTHLNLDGCGLSPGGAQALARYISKDTRLISISLAGNSLRDTGAAIIARAVTTNDKPALTLLSLPQNYISGKCEEDLAALALRHSGIIIDLSRNPLVVSRIESLLKLLPPYDFFILF